MQQPITQPTTNYPSSTTGGYPQSQATKLESSLLQRGQAGYGDGTVTLRAVEGRFNQDKDVLGKMDPYVKFKIGWHRGKTAVASGQGTNPRWDDSVVLKVKNQDYVKVKVKDKDRIIFNDNLGSAKIPLGSLFSLGKTSQWINLTKGEKLTGELLLEMEYLPTQEGAQRTSTF